MPIIDCNTMVGCWPHAGTEMTLESLLEGMRVRGVAQSLVTNASAVFYDATHGNQELTRLCAQQPSLIPVGVLNPLDYPRCLDEVNRCLEQGIRVFRFCPREHGYPFSPAVGPLRETLRRLGSSLRVTTAQKILFSSVAQALRSSLETSGLLLADISELPSPGVGAELEDLFPVPCALTVRGAGLGTVIHAARQSANVWVETSRLDAGGAIEAAIRQVGADRVVFGSGSPLRSLGSAVMSVQYAQLGDSERTAIFETNVQRALT